ncbi:MAG: ATP-binding protein [Micromonosporaceae bacterium]
MTGAGARPVGVADEARAWVVGTFGRLLRSLRLAAGHTQESLAAKAGVSPRAISYLETGRISHPQLATVDALADALTLSSDMRERMRADAGRSGELRPISVPHQLPAPTQWWVGRESESHTALRWGRGGGVLVVSGMPGVGKTAFALRIAELLASRFPDGQLFADLRGAGENRTIAPEVLAGFLRALSGAGAQVASGVDEASAHFRSAVAGRRVLVLLDDAATEGQVRPLLPGSPGCLTLVTSRRALTGLPNARLLVLDALPSLPATQLLHLIAGEHVLDRESPSAIDALVEVCGGLPLAIRVVGGRLASRPRGGLARILVRLRGDQERFLNLSSGDLDLRRVFDESYLALPAPTQVVFRRLGLFPGPDFTVEAAAVLAGVPVDQAEDAVDRLVDDSLVQITATGRHRLHDLVRRYAMDRCRVDDDPTMCARAIQHLCRWYLVAADAADRVLVPVRVRPALDTDHSGLPPVTVATTAQALDWLEGERANAVAVAAAAARHGQHLTAWQIAAAVGGQLELCGYTDECVSIHEIGLASARANADASAEAGMLNGLGTAYWHQERFAEAIECYRRAGDIWHQLNDPRGVAAMLNNLGSAYGIVGRHEEAIECLRQALSMSTRVTDADPSYALHNLGHAYHESGRHREALAALGRALRIRRAKGNTKGAAITMHCLGDTLLGLGRPHDACRWLLQALGMFRHHGNRYGEAAALRSLASVHRVLHLDADAAELLQAAIPLYRALGRRTDLAAANYELDVAASG